MADLYDLSPVNISFDLWRNAQTEWAKQVDPFGAVTAIGLAAQTWWFFPQALSERLGTLVQDSVKVQHHIGLRALGLPSPDPVSAHPDDTRFSDPVWTEQPAWDAVKECYLLYTHWLQDALYATPGLSDKERRRVAFWVRTWLNALSPTNFLALNPVAQQRAIATGGESLRAGCQRWWHDLERRDIAMSDEHAFQVGTDLATTPGAVVYQNRLLEVIHYSPVTEQVHATPVVLISPWINKYYVMDLNSKKSLAGWLVRQGYNVFITSWNNPGSELRDLTFEDYLTDGIGKIVDVARSISGSPQVHAVGYCIGGTLLTAYLAWQARHYPVAAERPVAHYTLLATLTDFSAPGDIEVFIDDPAITAIERLMEEHGYLDGQQMATSFRLLRSNSLIWDYWVSNYLLGKPPAAFDVLFWNMDTTRMPQAMHRFYLRELYLHNRLIAPDALQLAGQPIDLSRIDIPGYLVGASEDHIAPWRSTFQLVNHVSGSTEYTLTSSGHILGIINPPVQPPKRQFWHGTATLGDTPERWQARSTLQQGSWWEHWHAWLAPRCGELIAPPPPSNRQYRRLRPAPGEYVFR
jgi:polyhydroxyalkanoate synthase